MTMRLLDVEPTEAEPAPKPIRGGKRFRQVPTPEQCTTEFRCLNDMVKPDDLVRAVRDVVRELDLKAIEDAYPGGGAPAYPPRYVLTLLLFGYMAGVRAGRELERACQIDVRFMWLAGGLDLDHELFSDFRRRFAKEIRELWKQTVRLGMAARLITMEHVAVDGTKIAAHAKRKALSQEDIDKLMPVLDERIQKLMAEAEALDSADEAMGASERAGQIPQELLDTQDQRARIQRTKQLIDETGWDRVSETDPEAPVQKTMDGKRPGYNAQAAVDAASGMVVGQFLTDAQNDTQELPEMCEQIEDNTGFKPGALGTDTGFGSEQALRHLQRNNINGYVKQKVGNNSGGYPHEAFEYDPERNLYICPTGHELPFKRTKKLRNDTECRVFMASAKCCGQCEKRAECLSPKATRRELVLVPHSELVSAMRRKLDTDEGREVMKMRSSTVEPAFGVIKAVFGLRQFLLRGKEGAAVEFSLACMALNMRKLTQRLVNGGDRAMLALQSASAR
jgi:transposase